MTQTPSMHGKVCLVTGATAGIGKATAMALARMGATVVLAGRDPAKLAATVSEIQAGTGNAAVSSVQADLLDPRQIRQMAQTFMDQQRQLDVLINNAGALFPERGETPEGIERTWALNHMSYFLLTEHLLEMLKASAPARIVSVASEAHRFASIRFDDLHGRRFYNGWLAYSQSKLANVLWTYEVDRRLRGTGVTANVLHPGAVASNFLTNGGPVTDAFNALVKVVGVSPERGAQTSIYLASSPEVEGVSGRYFRNRRAVASSSASYDLATARRLWQVSEDLSERGR